MAADKKPFERLPTDVVPTNYKLELRPDLKLFKFTGTLNITVDVSSSELAVPELVVPNACLLVVVIYIYNEYWMRELSCMYCMYSRY